MKRHADTDAFHDPMDDCSESVPLTPDQAEAAAILGWPITAYRSGPRARLTPAQRRVLADLCTWHNNGTTQRKEAS